MSYIEKSLVSGETVLYRARLHWIVMLWHAVIGACIFVTVFGPFIMRAAWKDLLATKSALDKFFTWQEKNGQSVIRTGSDDATARAVRQ